MSWIADIMEYNEEVKKSREKWRKRMKKPLFEVQSKLTGNFYNVYKKKTKRIIDSSYIGCFCGFSFAVYEYNNAYGFVSGFRRKR